MRTNLSIMKRVAAAAALAVSFSAMANAADNGTESKAQAFAEQNAYWQELSTGMPAGSPPVDKSVQPADPIPPAHNQAEEIARFKDMDAQLQAESTNMPVGSPPVNRSEPAADPIPKATTLAEKEARFKAEDHFLQEMSTH
jgi:hypothetical protein